MILQPAEQLEKLRMQRRLAAGQLENLDAALAVNHALDAVSQIVQRHGIHFLTGANRRIAEARRAAQVAGVNDFDEAQARREFFHHAEGVAGIGVAAERAGIASGRRLAAVQEAGAAGIFRFPFCEPVKPRVGGDADARLAVPWTGALEKNLRRNSARAPDLGGTRLVADRAARHGALEQFVGQSEIQERGKVHPPILI